MSPIYSPDIEVQSVIQYGIDQIRANINVLDEIFANLKEGHLNALYGDREIQAIKEWFARTSVPVILGFSLDDTRIPSYSVHLAQESEDVQNAFLNDWAGTEDQDIHPRVIVSSFVPATYDVSAGMIVAADTVDLDLVVPGHYIADANDVKYLISDVTEQTILVELNPDSTLVPDFSKVQVESFINTATYKRGEAYFNTQLDVGVHARDNPNMVIWLYSILTYILFRYKSEISTRCMDLTTYSASDFSKDSQYIASNVYSRWIRLSARTRVSWKEDLLPKIDTLTVDVKEE
jgi:hypothetical protein